jgi:hypothetical protein
LDWSDVSGASGYEVQYANTIAGVESATAVVAASSQYQVATGLDLGTWYWRVRAKNSDNVWCAWSSTWSFTVQWTYSITPNPASGATITDTTPLLDWSDVSGASGYEVQYANTSAGVASATAVAATSSQYQYPTTLALGDAVYWRVRAKNSDNVWGAWSSTWSFTVVEPTLGGPGQAGGIIFYDKGSYSVGWRYLEAWTADESGTYQWKTSYTTTGGTSTAIGTGAANTTAMAGTAHPAAERARNATYGGYDDWFLPSKDELNQMYIQRSVIGGFASDYYWSSSEYDYHYAWTQNFGVGSQYDSYKDNYFRVRLVRAF